VGAWEHGNAGAGERVTAMDGRMNRREFLGLSAGIPSALAQRGGRRAAAGPDARWRFALDGQSRWTLARAGAVAIQGAEIAIEVAGAPPFTLGALDDLHHIRSGSRRTGEAAWTVVGRQHGLEITATFEDDVRPQVVVGVRGLEDARDLVAVHFTNGVSTSQRRAWINGYQSWSGCRMVDLNAGTDATGFWQLALLGTPGLAMAFGEDDGSSGEFRLTGRGLDALGRFTHRAVSADHPPAVCSLAILPAEDPFAALAADAATRVGPLRSGPVPAGWCSWYELYARVTEEDVLASLDVARHQFDPRFFRTIQIDDGFQRAAGDWETNEKFPHGHRWLTDRIHDAGFEAGLWMAPFAVTMPSGIPAVHPEWLLLGDDGRPLPLDVQPQWGGQAYGLDASQRDVQDWLRELARHAVGAWGYDYLKLDFLYYAARGGRPERGASGHEALRAGLRALRQGAGRAFVLGCGAPLQHALGLVDGMRIGGDVDASWAGVQPGASAALLRAHLHERAWRNDPDALVVREPLTLAEARAWASVVALSGQMTLASDRLERLGLDRTELLRRAMPAAPVRGRALDLAPAGPASAPALLAGDALVAPLPRFWRFRAGDDLAWADPSLDDAAWETIEVGKPWEEAGHQGLDGYAWYRASFMAPRRAPVGALSIALGKIDDVDETFLNGVRVGATGSPPPDYHAEWQAFRRYPLEKDAVQWGQSNTVAVRVYDGGGAGGIWRLTRDAPPSLILCRAREDWWTLGMVNWTGEPKRLSADLAAAGAAGLLAAYDVWEGTRAADVASRVALTVAPHSAMVLGLRRPRRVPFVLGSSRHIVQGAVDIEEESWDARRRTLSGRSVQLDGRPYALTLALPPGFRPQRCLGSVPSAIAETTPRAARLEFIGTRDDIVWEVEF
jgi:hypothetical protein